MIQTLTLAAIALAANAIHVQDNMKALTKSDDKDQSAPGQSADKSKFSQIFRKGNCPKIELLKNVDFTLLAGDWYTHRTINASMFPAECYHAVCKVNEDGSLTSSVEMRLAGHYFRMDHLNTFLVDDLMHFDFFDNKVQIQGGLLLMNDKYIVDYACFDHFDFQLDKELEPVHFFMLGISTRDPATTP